MNRFSVHEEIQSLFNYSDTSNLHSFNPQYLNQ